MKYESLEKFLADARIYFGLDGASLPNRFADELAGQPRREIDSVAPGRWRLSQSSEELRRSLD